jgi:hypothetical protein
MIHNNNMSMDNNNSVKENIPPVIIVENSEHNKDNT